MWIIDLEIALEKLFDRYGLTCCVEKIEGNVITMSNGDMHSIPELIKPME